MTRLSSEAEIVEFVRAAREKRAPFEIVAGGTRRGAGRPMATSDGKPLPVADVSGLSGIVEYQPEELIITARPGTTLAEIKATLMQRNQCLGFDPVDWTLFGASGKATLGGAVSADASGSGRLRYGGPRDSLLGFRAVNGLGEAFRGGAKVVKNVTGFDLPKLACGAFGTLMVLSEVTFRVFPRPLARVTLIKRDMAPEAGFAVLRAIWKSALEPSGLAYIPGTAAFPGSPFNNLGDVGEGAALIRFEAAERPLAEKAAAAKLLAGGLEELPEGDAIFAAIGEGAIFRASELDVWRVCIPPSAAAKVAAAISAPLWLGDWAGGLLWAGGKAEDGPRIRKLAAEAGGHAMLLRAPAARRAELGLYPPQPAALAAVSQSLRAAFDPLGLFNPGRL
ncbi:MAG TPA: FAD-binding protein [Rhizomicrobium sp.]|nr:FAD-binding protein [Rhizomicrobium sp.]